MDQPSSSSSPAGSRRREEPEFNLREWGLKARISRENTNSRRFSASFIRSSFREDTRSFRSNITISSTASSPGYSLRDEIDPSTYSFTTALQALQARSAYNCWECLSPDGFALNSKWSEAEKYICNPLSGEFPMECLSAKTLSGRSFRSSLSLTNRITMSAPLIYSSNSHHHLSSRQIQTRPYHNNNNNNNNTITLSGNINNNGLSHEEPLHQLPVQEKRMEAMAMAATRDVGTQSTPHELSSSSLSPASTPSIIERSLKRCEVEAGDDSPSSNANVKSQQQVKERETREEEERRIEEEKIKENKDDNNKQKQRRRGSGGCLSWMSKRHNDKHKPRKFTLFLPKYLKGC